MSDELEEPEDIIETTAFVIEEGADGSLNVEDLTRRLTEEERIVLLLRALLVELAPLIVHALESLPDEDDDE